MQGLSGLWMEQALYIGKIGTFLYAVHVYIIF